MKSIILCFFVLATLVVSIHSFRDEPLDNDQLQKLLDIMQKCQQAVEAEALSKDLKDISEKNNAAHSPLMKKSLACIAVRLGVVKDNGEFNKEILRQILKMTTNKDKVDNVIQACAIKKSSNEETVYDFIGCMFGLKD